MFTGSSQQYHRCYISAPFGLDLGALPRLLGEREIAWNWGALEGSIEYQIASNIEKCDFVVAVLNGSRSDYRVMYEIGIAEGLRKPVFALATNKRVNQTIQSTLLVASVGLREKSPLAFQLDAFLSTPHESIFQTEREKVFKQRVTLPKFDFPRTSQGAHGAIEKRIFDAVQEAGGSSIVEPTNLENNTRPDLLIWLADQEPELLDPAVIEIKRESSTNMARKVEDQLLRFMNVSGIKVGFLLTEHEPIPSFRFKSPYLFWLSIDSFVALTRDGRLGMHVRELRNRAAHGIK